MKLLLNNELRTSGGLSSPATITARVSNWLALRSIGRDDSMSRPQTTRVTQIAMDASSKRPYRF